MAYGKNKGRFRETRVGRFAANMGAEEPPVKSTGVEDITQGRDLASANAGRGVFKTRKPPGNERWM
jgi:hypothetical protein